MMNAGAQASTQKRLNVRRMAVISVLSAISIVLTYFAVKFVFNKKDEEAIKTFVLVEVIYIVVAFILSFIGIYI